jgi:hypothetical protein
VRENSPAQRAPRRGAAPLAALLFLATLAAASIWLLQPPAAVPDSAPPDSFSSARALRHLREIARRPHPTGTEESARVRAYLVEQLGALGLRAETQAAEAVTPQRASGGPASAGRVENVVARLPGAESTRALMLAVHYDSVPTAPGASDDGAGVAALLETLRALRAGPPLRNDLVLVFTDGEELGLLGAEAFAAAHPWMRDVGLVLSFEARGAGGPSMMFETSDGNGRLVEALAESAPRPVASSLMYAVYKLLPNDTDLTVFKRAGAPGLNFAYAGRLTHYHTMLDSVEEIDERSLQHHGEYALALARRFGNDDLRETRAGDAVYFNAFGPALVRYPAAWVVPATLALVALYAVAFVYGLRRRNLTWKGTAAGVVTLLAAGGGAWLLTAGAWYVVRRLYPGFDSLPWRTPYELWVYACGLTLLALGTAWAACALLFRRTRRADLWAGALAWWVLLLLVSTLILPLGSFLYAWPLLFALVGFVVLLASRETETGSTTETLIVVLASAPGVALVAPLVYMFFVMLGLDIVAVYVVLIALLAGLAAPLFRRAAWAWPVLTICAGLALLAYGLATAGFDARRPKVNSVFYLLDADAGRAQFLSADAAPDEWTAQFVSPDARPEPLERVLPWSRARARAGEAPAAELAAPAVELLDDRADARARTVRLRVTSPRGAHALLAHTEGPTEVLRAHVGRHEVVARAPGSEEAHAYGLRLLYAAPPPEGVEIVLELAPSSPLRLVVQDISYGLPELPGRAYAPRPAGMMPAPSRTSDTTLVRKTFELERRSR